MMSCMYGTLKALYFVVVLLKRIRYSHEKKMNESGKKNRAKLKRIQARTRRISQNPETLPDAGETLYFVLNSLLLFFFFFFWSEFDIMQYFCYLKNQRLQEYIKEKGTTQQIELLYIRVCRITLRYGFKNSQISYITRCDYALQVSM